MVELTFSRKPTPRGVDHRALRHELNSLMQDNYKTLDKSSLGGYHPSSAVGNATQSLIRRFTAQSLGHLASWIWARSVWSKSGVALWGELKTKSLGRSGNTDHKGASRQGTLLNIERAAIALQPMGGGSDMSHQRVGEAIESLVITIHRGTGRVVFPPPTLAGESLTTDERVVFDEMIHGLSAAEIAYALGLPEDLVEGRANSVCKKCGVVGQVNLLSKLLKLALNERYSIAIVGEGA